MDTTFTITGTQTDQPFYISLNKKRRNTLQNRLTIINFLVHFSCFLFTITQPFIASGIGISFFLFHSILIFGFRKLNSAVVDGEHLIIKNYKHESLITPLAQIQRVEYTRIGKNIMAKVHFNLDGLHHRSRIIIDNKTYLDIKALFDQHIKTRKKGRPISRVLSVKK